MPKIRHLLQRLLPASLPTNPSPLDAVDLAVYDFTEPSELDLSSMEWLQTAPVWMSPAERFLLFSLIFGLRPKRYLEIGTFRGGSALLTCLAMDMTHHDGSITCIDPEPKIAAEDWQNISHRTSVLEGFSPQILAQAFEHAGGAFDFVLIDGDHSYEGVKRDATGVLSFVTDGAYLLFHDSFFPDIAQALDDFKLENYDRIIDFGILTREVSTEVMDDGRTRQWGGLRMMQVRAGSDHPSPKAAASNAIP